MAAPGKPYEIGCLESLSFGLPLANERAVSKASVASGWPEFRDVAACGAGECRSHTLLRERIWGK